MLSFPLFSLLQNIIALIPSSLSFSTALHLCLSSVLYCPLTSVLLLSASLGRAMVDTALDLHGAAIPHHRFEVSIITPPALLCPAVCHTPHFLPWAVHVLSCRALCRAHTIAVGVGPSLFSSLTLFSLCALSTALAHPSIFFLFFLSSLPYPLLGINAPSRCSSHLRPPSSSLPHLFHARKIRVACSYRCCTR